MGSETPSSSTTEQTGRKIPGLSRLGHWARELAAVSMFIIALFGARSTLADHYVVPTGSMIPTVAIGDRVVVNKLAYAVRVPFTDASIVQRGGPARGDVVVLRSPEDGSTLLKRVVAIPGDEVAVVGGHLSINGQRVPVDPFQGAVAFERLETRVHQVRLTRGGGQDFGPVRVGSDQYLVLGDNRGESHDGRAFGLVERRSILGKALGVWMRDGRLTWLNL